MNFIKKNNNKVINFLKTYNVSENKFGIEYKKSYKNIQKDLT